MSEVLVRSERRNERLTRDSWIQEGLLALTEHGEPAVRVDVIAKKLKISRGSFYWHFEDRADFLSAILKEWRHVTTTFIHEYLTKSGMSPARRLKYLLKLSTSGDERAPGGRIEQAISQWATYNVEAADILKIVHRERLEFTTALLKETDFERPAITAEILYSYIVGHNQLTKHISLDPSGQRKAALEVLGLGKHRATKRAKVARRK